MAELPVVYTSDALDDLLNITDYYFETVGLASAEKHLAALQNNVEKLARFPLMGEEHPDEYLKSLGFRKLVRENQIVIYRPEDDSVIIERIVWGSSDYPELFREQ